MTFSGGDEIGLRMGSVRSIARKAMRKNRRFSICARAAIASAIFLLGLADIHAVSASESGQDGAPVASVESGTSPASGASPVMLTPASPTYRIAPHDVLHVSVWKEPDLTATVQVRTDGKISVPLLDDVQASGLTPMQLSASLADRLRTYVDHPRVTVVVSQMHSERIYVVGEVLRPGPMVLLPDMTVLQALASVGMNQFARSKKIYVLRTVNNEQRKFFVNYKQLIKGQQMSQNIKLEVGDTIVVP